MGADFDASTPTLNLAAAAEHADARAHLSEVLRCTRSRQIGRAS